jgi:hypothetical protein
MNPKEPEFVSKIQVKTTCLTDEHDGKSGLDQV